MGPNRPDGTHDESDGHMDEDSFDEQRTPGARTLIATSVIAGMTLFIAGFAMTVMALPGDSHAEVDGAETQAADQDSGSGDFLTGEGLSLFLGLLLSMVGLCVATIIPAVVFIKRAKRNA